MLWQQTLKEMPAEDMYKRSLDSRGIFRQRGNYSAGSRDHIRRCIKAAEKKQSPAGINKLRERIKSLSGVAPAASGTSTAERCGCTRRRVRSDRNRDENSATSDTTDNSWKFPVANRNNKNWRLTDGENAAVNNKKKNLNIVNGC